MRATSGCPEEPKFPSGRSGLGQEIGLTWLRSRETPQAKADEPANFDEANGGMVELTTAAGGKPTAKQNGSRRIVLIEAKVSRR